MTGSTLADDHQQNLHFMRREAIETLCFLTSIVGFGLVLIGLQYVDHRLLGLIGIVVMFAPFAIHRLLNPWYLVNVWCLVAVWLAIGVGFVLAWPDAGALCLLALPVGLATLLIGPKAGAFTGVIASLGVVAFGTSAPLEASSPKLFVVLFLIWALVLTLWLSTRPIDQVVRWSWENYERARQELDQTRELHADLQQVVSDLADAGVQMARLNEQLASARRYAEDAERAKAEFVASVSHELRTPLNMIIGFAEMITDSSMAYGARLPSQLLADVAAIRRNGQHLANLVNDVLDMSQIEAQRMVLRRDWDSLAEIIQSAVLAVRPLIESRRLYLQIDVAEDLPWVYCDRTRIRQVLLNLLNNAARATETGGVTIEARVAEDMVAVTVHDTGSGIAEADLSKLFEPFRQFGRADNGQSRGNGLGLSISRHFVEMHGGHMSVQSRVGEGSSFSFRLPVERPAADPATVARWIPSTWEPRRHAQIAARLQVIPRMIILEPADVLRASAERYLDGVTIESAVTPADVHRLLSASLAQLVLVRSESTEQAFQQVNELADLPVPTPIVACVLAPTQQGANGVNGYLVKPITRAQLLRTIEEMPAPVSSVLIVDDDSEALQLFARILASAPERYRVLQASSGPEALDLLRARRPDLLLLDLAMPGMDGFAVIAEKCKDPQIKDIPVLILSAHDPSGQPIVVSSFFMTQSGGLSLPGLFRSALTLSAALASLDLTPPAAPRA